MATTFKTLRLPTIQLNHATKTIETGTASVMKADRWITIGADKEDGGGVHIKIDDDGKIVAGPDGIAKRGITHLDDFGGKKEEKKPARKPKKEPKKTESVQTDRKEGEANPVSANEHNPAADTGSESPQKQESKVDPRIAELADNQISLANSLRKHRGEPELKFKLQMVPIDQVQQTQWGDDHNNDSSRHLAKHIDKFRSSGRKEDYAPIALDENMMIIDGNHRHYAHQSAGLKEIPALVPVNVNSESEIRQNRLSKLREESKKTDEKIARGGPSVPYFEKEKVEIARDIKKHESGGSENTKPESKPSKKPGVPGMQQNLFDEDGGGQKQLFNYVPPKKGDNKPKETPAPSTLEKIGDDQKERERANAPIAGQRELIGDQSKPSKSVVSASDIRKKTHKIDDIVNGKYRIGAEGRGGKDLAYAKEHGLATVELGGHTFFAKTDDDLKPIVDYFSGGGKYGSPEMSRILGYSESEIDEYKRFLSAK